MRHGKASLVARHNSTPPQTGCPVLRPLRAGAPANPKESHRCERNQSQTSHVLAPKALRLRSQSAPYAHIALV